MTRHAALTAALRALVDDGRYAVEALDYYGRYTMRRCVYCSRSVGISDRVTDIAHTADCPAAAAIQLLEEG